MSGHDHPSNRDFYRLASWSVEYNGVAYDDARQIGGIWYSRDIVTKKVSRFQFQDLVVALSANRHALRASAQ